MYGCDNCIRSTTHFHHIAWAIINYEIDINAEQVFQSHIMLCILLINLLRLQYFVLKVCVYWWLVSSWPWFLCWRWRYGYVGRLSMFANMSCALLFPSRLLFNGEYRGSYSCDASWSFSWLIFALLDFAVSCFGPFKSTIFIFSRCSSVCWSMKLCRLRAAIEGCNVLACPSTHCKWISHQRSSMLWRKLWSLYADH